jgi:hypothetical protein
MKSKKTYQPWMDRIQVGSVLRSRSGDLRVVRDTKKRIQQRGAWKGCKTISVYFAIRRCSWTGRCYTVMTDNDLTQQGFTYTGIRLKLQTDVDFKIAESIESGEYTMTCCDVKGIL